MLGILFGLVKRTVTDILNMWQIAVRSVPHNCTVCYFLWVSGWKINYFVPNSLLIGFIVMWHISLPKLKMVLKGRTYNGITIFGAKSVCTEVNFLSWNIMNCHEFIQILECWEGKFGYGAVNSAPDILITPCTYINVMYLMLIRKIQHSCANCNETLSCSMALWEDLLFWILLKLGNKCGKCR
jgi:hypothetical protein